MSDLGIDKIFQDALIEELEKECQKEHGMSMKELHDKQVEELRPAFEKLVAETRAKQNER